MYDTWEPSLQGDGKKVHYPCFVEAQLAAQAIFTTSGRVAAVLFSQLWIRVKVQLQLPVFSFNFQTIAIKQTTPCESALRREVLGCKVM